MSSRLLFQSTLRALRPAYTRLNHRVYRPYSSSPPSPLKTASSPAQPLTKQPLEPRLSMTFTCTVSECGKRSTHEFTKRSYERGIVIVQCPGCENRHLIADHLGWFKDDTENGKMRTVEDFMKAKGEKVQRGYLHNGGDIEYVED